jgi:hypothetical protein
LCAATASGGDFNLKAGKALSLIVTFRVFSVLKRASWFFCKDWCVSAHFSVTAAVKIKNVVIGDEDDPL